MSDGEDWKGEGPLGGFLSSFRVLTPEERERYAKERVQRIAAGDLNRLTLQTYHAERHCPKCDHPKAHTSYRPSGAADSWSEQTFGSHDGLQRTCKRCSYCWGEKCLDDKEAV